MDALRLLRGRRSRRPPDAGLAAQPQRAVRARWSSSCTTACGKRPPTRPCGCVVLGHTGGTFCAGADLSEASGGDPFETTAQRARELTGVLRAIVESPMPVIAAVDGHVRAGGMGLVGACDIVVAGPRSTFALTEARIGVAPAIISLTLLPKMSARAAARYYLTGETFGAARGRRDRSGHGGRRRPRRRRSPVCSPIWARARRRGWRRRKR